MRQQEHCGAHRCVPRLEGGAVGRAEQRGCGRRVLHHRRQRHPQPLPSWHLQRKLGARIRPTTAAATTTATTTLPAHSTAAPRPISRSPLGCALHGSVRQGRTPRPSGQALTPPERRRRGETPARTGPGTPDCSARETPQRACISAHRAGKGHAHAREGSMHGGGALREVGYLHLRRRAAHALHKGLQSVAGAGRTDGSGGPTHIRAWRELYRKRHTVRTKGMRGLDVRTVCGRRSSRAAQSRYWLQASRGEGCWLSRSLRRPSAATAAEVRAASQGTLGQLHARASQPSTANRRKGMSALGTGRVGAGCTSATLAWAVGGVLC